MTVATRVVAIVPAKDSADTIGSAVTALIGTGRLDEVIVIDDGSADATGSLAVDAGATVYRLPRNCGKAAAVTAALKVAPDANVYLLVDADTGEFAAQAVELLTPVFQDQADLTIAVLPSAAGRGGFGTVSRVASEGIRRLCGWSPRAPLSGQRAVRGDLLRSLTLTPRFGLEVGMTIDAVRNGARVLEMEVPMEHRHRGRSLAGFAHRGAQGLDVLRALAPRWLPDSVKVAIVLVALVCGLGVNFALSDRNSQVAGTPVTSGVTPGSVHIPVVVVPDWNWENFDSQLRGAMGSIAIGDLPNPEFAMYTGNRSDGYFLPDFGYPVARPQEVRSFPADKLRIFVGLPSDSSRYDDSLRPVLVTGAGSGTLTSSSTRRLGLVDLVDIAPTQQAVEVSNWRRSFDGSVLRVVPGQANLVELAKLDNVSRFYEHFRPRAIVVYSLVIALVCAIAYLRHRSRCPGETGFIGRLAVFLAAAPLVFYLLRWVQTRYELGILLWSALCVLGIAMIATMSRVAAPRITTPLSRVLLATIVLILVDLWTGSHLQLSGILGSSPILAARYYGLGNPASVVLLIATVLWTVLHVQASSGSRLAVLRALALYVVVMAAVALPGLGSDVGGLISFAATGVLLFVAVSPRRFNAKVASLVVLLPVFMLGLIAALESMRPLDQRSHLGRLVGRILTEGPGALWDIVERKAILNWFSYGFPFSLILLALAIAGLGMLLQSKPWQQTLLPGSVARRGTAVAVAGGLIAFAVNDSGIVVLALVGVFLVPFLLVQHELSRSVPTKLEVVRS